MQQRRAVLAGKFAAVLAVVPALIYAFSSGPEARKTGAPGDQLCTQAGCHVGTANPAGGRVEVVFPGGMTYTPGQKQRLTVTITDPGGVYGFQLTARLASNEANGQAGTFSPVDASTAVICEDSRPRPAPGCPAPAPLEFIQHTQAGAANSFTFEWTPPAADAGNVRIYVAGNRGNGNGAATGDRIYTANYTLTPAAGTPAQRPAIRAEQPVLQAFSARPGLSSGTWLEIYGTNLSSATRAWTGGDFDGNKAPTRLEGVGVNINGKPAFVRYVSPTQVNVQAPDDDAVGPVTLEVVNAGGTSNAVTLQKTRVSPALLTTPAFNVNNRQYVAALHPDFRTFVGREGLIAGVPFRPAKPGDTIIVFAVGCGATNPASPAGQFFPDARPLALPFQARFGETAAAAQGFLAAGAVGLCQFNVTVPNLSSGDVPFDVTIDGTAGGQTLYTTIQQ